MHRKQAAGSVGLAGLAPGIISMAYESLFKLLSGARSFGVGQRVTRSIWHWPGTFWQVTRVRLKEGDPSHGKAWGVFYWKGVQKGGEREIRSPLKPQWRVLVAEEAGATATARAAPAAAAPKKAVAASASA